MKYTDADLLTLTEGTLLLDPLTGESYRMERPSFRFATVDGEFVEIPTPKYTGQRNGAFGWGGATSGYDAEALADIDLIVAWAPIV